MNSPNWIFIDDDWQKAGTPVLTAQSRAVMYGDGCFETVRSYSGAFLHLEAHLLRLRGGLEYLRISPPPGLSIKTLRESIGRLLKKNGMAETDSVVRIQVWREGDRGFRVSEKARTHYALTVSPVPEIPESIRLATVPTRRIPAGAIDPGFKLSNGINYIRAASEAARAGADDALMLTVDGFVSETTIANLFWTDGDSIYTPSRNCDILPGITRKILIDIIRKEMEVALTEGEFTLESLLECDAAWVCNSVRETVPVCAVDEREFTTSNSLYDELAGMYQAYRTKNLV